MQRDYRATIDTTSAYYKVYARDVRKFLERGYTRSCGNYAIATLHKSGLVDTSWHWAHTYVHTTMYACGRLYYKYTCMRERGTADGGYIPSSPSSEPFPRGNFSTSHSNYAKYPRLHRVKDTNFAGGNNNWFSSRTMFGSVTYIMPTSPSLSDATYLIPAMSDEWLRNAAWETKKFLYLDKPLPRLRKNHAGY